MNVLFKSSKKLLIEISIKEIEMYGFDDVWDDIRSDFPELKYDICSFDIDSKFKDLLFVEFNIF